MSSGTSSVSTNSNPFADANLPDVNDLRRLNILERVPVRLSQADSSYHTWKTYFSLVFWEYHLMDHVDGTVDSSLVPEFHDWPTIDTTIIRWFFLTITPDLFQTVVMDGDDACAVWTKLNGLFTDNKLQRRVNDDLLLSTLAAGLNEDFDNAAGNLSLIPNPCFAKFVAYLRLEERRMKQVKTRAIHTALATGTTRGGPPAPSATLAPQQRHQAPFPAPKQPGLLPLPYGPPAPPAETRHGGRRGGRRGGPQQQPQQAGQQQQQFQAPQQLQVPPPWTSGYNPWTGVVYAYTMPVPRAPAPTLPVPRPPVHQAFYAAPQPYGGYPPPQMSGAYDLPVASPPPSLALPPAPWDPALLAALHVAPTPNNYTGGGDWYMDTGATAHMFAHPDNLASFTRVTTDRRIIVGDGSTLPITHVGHTSFPSTSMPITLSNIFVSPHLIKNLVSVRCLTRENPVTVEFDELGFCVKDA
ncbi:uncharacterized protein [Aegilops tauschii subsp. strangulata]|uniref:uncharacterized protein n=1 Tax=Aegilops tauschii subsp. strangulata TaxID=200361 RepID=UPI00098A774E|nr:uncharacterized protein LOC109779842 [Aegilops tauschii subsp. strangulata]